MVKLHEHYQLETGSMLKAFININLKARTMEESIATIKTMKGVIRIYTMTGASDLLVEFEGEDTTELHDFHHELDAIESIEGVITNVVMKEFEP
ncbi:hypothetical protein GF325_17210 [Candidatus Bathyarchaeota archaeon]|nr:hypothetical protein [Candidatus Bathyarchaeota archaeon]